MSLESLLMALTPSEKVEAMEILWRDLTTNGACFPSPNWHGTVLADRLAHPSPKPSLPLDDAIQDVRNRLNSYRTQG